MGSQSHKCGCLCGTNPKEKESVDSELARNRVNRLLLEVAIDFWVKSDCKNFKDS